MRTGLTGLYFVLSALRKPWRVSMGQGSRYGAESLRLGDICDGE